MLIVASSEKARKVYCHNGLLMYFTDRTTNRTVMSWSGADFKRFAAAEEHVNQPYNEAFISVVTLADEQFYIEHDEKLDFDEIGAIVGFVAGALAKMGAEHGK